MSDHEKTYSDLSLPVSFFWTENRKNTNMQSSPFSKTQLVKMLHFSTIWIEEKTFKDFLLLKSEVGEACCSWTWI